MTSQITVGLTRKIGLPRYSSLGAGCEVTLDGPDPTADPLGFAEQVRRAFAACDRAVCTELEQRAKVHSDTEIAQEEDEQPCTQAQSRALAALCRRNGLDLEAVTRSRHGTERADLTANQAAILITELQTPAALAS